MAMEPSSAQGRGELPAICNFGRYELLGRLAVGGMAEIYLAREPVAGGASRRLVVKRILSHVADDPEFAEMFLNEARVAMGLRHPNICHIYEFGELDGSCFIAMEWVDGVPLGKLIKRASDFGGIPVPVAAKVASQVAEALHYAHRAKSDDGRPLGVVHRDVSPQNIMVSYDGAVKLLDFGIAKAADEHHRTTQGQVKGKFAYMSPEQCLGEPVDCRSDVFALGICLYEALAGRHLYRGKTQYDTMRAVLESPVPSVREVRSDVPQLLDSIVQRALAKDASERFQTAGEMQEALEQWLANERQVVHAGRVSSLLERMFEDEIQSGPSVDSSQHVVEALSRGKAALEMAPADTGASASGPPRRSSRLKWALLLGAPIVLGLLVGTVAVGAWWLGRASGETGEAAGAGEGRAGAQPPSERPAGTPALPPLPDPEAGHGGTGPASSGEAGGSGGETGGMAVGSTPEGAIVRVDGERVGTTPVTVDDLDEGAHEVAVSRRGYRTFREQVEVDAQERAVVRAELERRPRGGGSGGAGGGDPPAEADTGRLSINTRPWSKVYVGDRLLGTTPIGKAEVPAGTVRLRIVDRDGRTHRQAVKVRAGQETSTFYDFDEEGE